MSEEKNATIETVAKGIENMAAKLADTEAKLADIGAVKNEVLEVKQRLEIAEEAAAKGRTELETLLEHKMGSRSEAVDHVQHMGGFIKSVWQHQKHGKPMPAEFKDSPKVDGEGFRYVAQKAVADFTTDTDATAGYLIGSAPAPAVVAAHDLYGGLVPLVTKYTVPAGIEMPINARTSNPAATWGVQGGAMVETEFVYAQDTVKPERLSLYVKISNEMLNAPGNEFTTDVTAAFLEAMVKHEETGMIQGDEDGLGSALDPPSDGLLVAASTSDQTNISGNTTALLMAFLGEGITDNAELANVNEAIVMMTPAKFWALLAQIGATNNNGLLTFNGSEARIAGVKIVPHPAMLISTTHWAAHFRPRDFILATSGTMAIDFNPWGTGWTSNETWMRGVTHADWSLGGINSRFSKADYS